MKPDLLKPSETMSPIEFLQYCKEFLALMDIDLDKLVARIKNEIEQTERKGV